MLLDRKLKIACYSVAVQRPKRLKICHLGIALVSEAHLATSRFAKLANELATAMPWRTRSECSELWESVRAARVEADRAHNALRAHVEEHGCGLLERQTRLQTAPPPGA